MRNNVSKFYDRVDETDLIWSSIKNDNSFIVITGRRRIGKTRLIREDLKGKERAHQHRRAAWNGGPDAPQIPKDPERFEAYSKEKAHIWKAKTRKISDR